MSTPTPRRPLVRRHALYTEDQYEDQASSQPCTEVASCPGLLTPVFVALKYYCGIKLITCSYLPGSWVDVWRNDTFCIAVRRLPKPKQCHPNYLTALPDVNPLVAVWSVVAFSNAFTYSFLGMCHSSTYPPNVQVYVTACHQSYQAFPRVSTASDKCWGE